MADALDTNDDDDVDVNDDDATRRLAPQGVPLAFYETVPVRSEREKSSEEEQKDDQRSRRK